MNLETIKFIIGTALATKGGVHNSVSGDDILVATKGDSRIWRKPNGDMYVAPRVINGG